MNNLLHLPKIVKGRPSTVTLQIMYEYIESLEKRREEREVRSSWASKLSFIMVLFTLIFDLFIVI